MLTHFAFVSWELLATTLLILRLQSFSFPTSTFSVLIRSVTSITFFLIPLGVSPSLFFSFQLLILAPFAIFVIFQAILCIFFISLELLSWFFPVLSSTALYAILAEVGVPFHVGYSISVILPWASSLAPPFPSFSTVFSVLTFLPFLSSFWIWFIPRLSLLPLFSSCEASPSLDFLFIFSGWFLVWALSWAIHYFSS